jgi:hypothetical protein
MLNTLGERVVFSYIIKFQYIFCSHRVGYVNDVEMYRNICVIAMLGKVYHFATWKLWKTHVDNFFCLSHSDVLNC